MKTILIISLLVNALLVTARGIEIYISSGYRSSIMTYYDGESLNSTGVIKSVCRLEYKGVSGYGYVVVLNDVEIFVTGRNDLHPRSIGEKVKFTFTIMNVNGVKNGWYEIYGTN